jgi:hypothetical protein
LERRVKDELIDEVLNEAKDDPQHLSYLLRLYNNSYLLENVGVEFHGKLDSFLVLAVEVEVFLRLRLGKSDPRHKGDFLDAQIKFLLD